MGNKTYLLHDRRARAPITALFKTPPSPVWSDLSDALRSKLGATISASLCLFVCALSGSVCHRTGTAHIVAAVALIDVVVPVATAMSIGHSSRVIMITKSRTPQRRLKSLNKYRVASHTSFTSLGRLETLIRNRATDKIIAYASNWANQRCISSEFDRSC